MALTNVNNTLNLRGKMLDLNAIIPSLPRDDKGHVDLLHIMSHIISMEEFQTGETNKVEQLTPALLYSLSKRNIQKISSRQFAYVRAVFSTLIDDLVAVGIVYTAVEKNNLYVSDRTWDVFEGIVIGAYGRPLPDKVTDLYRCFKREFDLQKRVRLEQERSEKLNRGLAHVRTGIGELQRDNEEERDLGRQMADLAERQAQVIERLEEEEAFLESLTFPGFIGVTNWAAVNSGFITVAEGVAVGMRASVYAANAAIDTVYSTESSQRRVQESRETLQSSYRDWTQRIQEEGVTTSAARVGGLAGAVFFSLQAVILGLLGGASLGVIGKRIYGITFVEQYHEGKEMLQNMGSNISYWAGAVSEKIYLYTHGI